MDAFFTSALTVAVAEIGDKTQLLSLVLAARFRNKWAIIAGILVATLVNHGISAWLGHYIGGFFSSDLGHWVVGSSFLLLAIWLLFPDKDEAVAALMGQAPKIGQKLLQQVMGQEKINGTDTLAPSTFN